MFEPFPLVHRGGPGSDRHGVIERHPTLAISTRILDPGDCATHGPVAQHTVRKYLRSDSVEPRFATPDRPSRLDPLADKLAHMLRQEAAKSRKQKRTVKQLHADLVALGYDGSYNRVAAFAREWKAARHREQQTCGRSAFVPLCARYRRMLARGKKAPIVITAIARELVGFMWAIARQVEPKTIGA